MGKGGHQKLVPVMFYVKAVFRISSAGMPETKPHLSFVLKVINSLRLQTFVLNAAVGSFLLDLLECLSTRVFEFQVYYTLFSL